MLIFYSLKFPKVAFPKVNGNNDNWEHHHCWDYQEFPVLNSIRNRNKNRRESRSSASFQQINSPAPIIKNAGRKLINRSKSICTIGQMYPEVIFKHFVLSDISSFHPSTFHPLIFLHPRLKSPYLLTASQWNTSTLRLKSTKMTPQKYPQGPIPPLVPPRVDTPFTAKEPLSPLWPPITLLIHQYKYLENPPSI